MTEPDDKRQRREQRIARYAAELLEDSRRHRIPMSEAEAEHKARCAYRPQSDPETPTRRRSRTRDAMPLPAMPPVPRATALQLALPL